MYPNSLPGYQTLLAYLPDQELDLAVLCNEEAPSVNAALTELQLRRTRGTAPCRRIADPDHRSARFR